MATEDVSIREGTVRYDIRFIVRVPHDYEQIQVIVNLEIQNNDTPGYPIPKRGIYYGSRLISAQKGSVFQKQEYGKIQKVVSIWVCESTAVSRSDTINEYYFHEKNRRGDYREDKQDYDLIRVIVMRLGSCGNDSGDNAIRLLSKILSSELTADEKKKALSDEFHINITTAIDEEVDRMCNLSTGILERGIERGMERGMKRGMERGMERGMKKGREEGIMETLFSLVKKGLITMADAAQQADMEITVFERKYNAYLDR